MTTITVEIGEEMFRFTSEQQWVNKAQSWFASCGVMKGNFICIDASGRVCRSGREFMRATREGTYPIICYVLTI